MKVHTTKGLIERELLEVTDIIENHDNARVTITQWRLDGELVRQDVNANILQGLALCSEQEEL